LNSILYRLKRCRQLVWQGVQTKKNMVFQCETDVLLAVSASVKLETNQGFVAILGEGKMLLLHRGTQVKLQPVLQVKEVQAQVYCLEFACFRLTEQNDERLVYLNDSSGLPPSGTMSGPLPHQTMQLLKQLLVLDGHHQQRHHYDSTTSSDDAQTLFNELLQIVLSSYPVLELVEQESTIQAAVEYIDMYYQQPITRETLARVAGFNTSYFSTLFSKQIGWGYSEYLNRVRIDRAKEHLLLSGLTVDEVAIKVGYTNGLYLSRKFKQYTGITPGEFRKQRMPKRIAAFQFVGSLLALGLKPVITDAELVSSSQLIQTELASIQAINKPYPAEQLEQVEPDLIIAPSYFYNMPGYIQKLERIAPLVTIEWGKLDSLAELRLFGRLLGKELEGERWIKKYMKRVELAKQQLRGLIERGETVALYEIRDEGIGIWDRTARGIFNLYDMLGLQPPDRIKQEVLEPRRHIYITEAQLPDYAADHMFVIQAQSEMSEAAVSGGLFSCSSIWQSLPAAQRNRIYPLKLDEFWCCDGIALERQLSIQVKWLMSSSTSQLLSI